MLGRLGRCATLTAVAMLTFLAPVAAADELTPERAKDVVGAVTLAPDDLPGWKVVESGEGTPDAKDRRLARCMGLDGAPPVATAVSPGFEQERTGTFVGAATSAVPTADEAARVVAQFGSSRSRRCLARYLRRAPARGKHLRTTVRPLWVPGPVAAGIRVRIGFRSGGKGFTMVEEFRVAAAGPLIISLVSVSVSGPLPEARARGLLATLRARADTALAAG